MNKRERVIAAFHGKETDHVPVCMWQHVPPAFWGDDDRFAAEQARAAEGSKLNYLTNAREIAITGVKGGKPTFNSVYDNGIYSFPICHEKWRFHPTQKPLELIKTMILKHSNENDLVLDCFSGSGTTAVACQKTGRRFIGCEISSEYFDKSVNRIESECGIKISQEKRQA